MVDERADKARETENEPAGTEASIDTGPGSRGVRRVDVKGLAVAGTVALLATVLLSYVLFHIAFTLLVVFAGVLFAILLDALTAFLTHHLRIRRGFGLALTVVILTALATGFILLTGPQVADQMGEIVQRIPEGIQRMEQELSERAWGRSLLNGQRGDKLADLQDDIMGGVPGAFGAAFGTVTNAVAALVLGIFLAVHPRTYVHNALRLVPLHRRERAGDVVRQVHQVLQWWLVARVASMVVVGILTTVGLLVVGVKMALALGLIAGLLSFVPFIGPIVSAVPAVLIGFLVGPTTALAVVVVFAVVQLLESNLVTPVIEQKTLSVPPGLSVFSQMTMAVLFSFVGVLLATPCLVVAITLIQMLYVEDVLEEPVELLAEH